MSFQHITLYGKFCFYTVIVFGGTNDIEKSKQDSNLTLTMNFLENTQNTTVILMEVPVRYDAGARTRISEQIVSYNKKLHKVTKRYKHVKLVRVTTSRNHFTTHGLHLTLSEHAPTIVASPSSAKSS